MADKTKVSVAEAVNGMISVAPSGSTLPTTASGALDAAFKTLGFISEDGVTNSNSLESTEHKDWNGTVVYVSNDGKTDTFQFKMLEVMNVDVLKVAYGEENVTENGGVITIKANDKTMPELSFVIDMILNGDVPKRVVIPSGKLTELGDVVYKKSELSGYDVTITATRDADGNTHYEYIGKTE